MRRIGLRDVQPGMVLARTIYDEHGNALLHANVTLSDRYVALLQQRAVYSIYIEDPDADDIEIEDVVSERVRVHTTQSLYRVFDAVDKEVRGLRVQAARGPAAKIPTGVPSIRQVPGYEELVQDIAELIDECVQAETYSGITSLRTHDTYSFFHALDMTVVAVVLGRRLYLDRETLHHVASGCILSDIGNVMLDPKILAKQGELTPEEVQQIRQHPVIGYELLRKMRPNQVIANHIAYQHHERQDGTGYPRGLKGTNRVFRDAYFRPQRGMILLVAEVAAVADTYVSLISDRPYRPALLPDQTVMALRQFAGTHLNREIVQQFLSILPVYPLGNEVMVKAGPYMNYRGIVSRVDPQALDRPRVRLLYNSHGDRIPPIEIDLREEQDTVISCL